MKFNRWEVEILRINNYDLLAAFLPGAASTTPTGGVPLVHHLHHSEYLIQMI